jgi:hypothetical protein
MQARYEGLRFARPAKPTKATRPPYLLNLLKTLTRTEVVGPEQLGIFCRLRGGLQSPPIYGYKTRQCEWGKRRPYGADIVFEFSYCVMSPLSHLPPAVGNRDCWLRGSVSQNVEYVCLTCANAYMFPAIMMPTNLTCGVHLSHPSPPEFSQYLFFIFQLTGFFLNHRGTWRATLSAHPSLQIPFNRCLRLSIYHHGKYQPNKRCCSWTNLVARILSLGMST